MPHQSKIGFISNDFDEIIRLSLSIESKNPDILELVPLAQKLDWQRFEPCYHPPRVIGLSSV
jgi:hypothetical protein